MRLIFLSDEKRIFEGEALKVSCFTDNGEIVIMKGHMPYISEIKKVVTITKERGEIQKYEIGEGYIYANGSECYIIANSI